MEELAKIKKDVNEFLSKNREKYELIIEFQNQLLGIDESSFSQIIDLLEKNKNIFFKDHQSIIFLFDFIISLSQNNFTNFEKILDVCIHFEAEFKNQQKDVTEYELMSICMSFGSSINYLFSKNFFSITTIIRKSFSDPYILYNFLPEIEKYDPEYAKLSPKRSFIQEKLEKDSTLSDFAKTVVSDYQKHILNRSLNYHPSPIHKSIREDDIETFQNLISKNNYKLNDALEFSYYERANTENKKLSPIKIASIYGSIKIFKFLLMNDVIIDDNLMNYAYFGHNSDIIHLIEKKCPFGDCYLEPLYNFHTELLDYFIDNFGNEIKETNEKVKIALENYEDEDDENNQYKSLNFKCLRIAVQNNIYSIIINCLPKIVYLLKYVDDEEKSSLLCYSISDIDLFKFFLNQKFPEFVETNVERELDENIFRSMKIAVCRYMNDSFKFLFPNVIYDIDNYEFLKKCCILNPELANYLLDLQINEKDKNEDVNEMFAILNEMFIFDDLLYLLNYYNEDIVVKIIQLYDPIRLIDDLSCFIKKIEETLSSKMIISLFEKLCVILKEDILVYIAAGFDHHKKYEISNFIKKKIE